eukprot:COSAG02_NODE_105_length_36393_cov_15.694495_8_plen_158_part_00
MLATEQAVPQHCATVAPYCLPPRPFPSESSHTYSSTVRCAARTPVPPDQEGARSGGASAKSFSEQGRRASAGSRGAACSYQSPPPSPARGPSRYPSGRAAARPSQRGGGAAPGCGHTGRRRHTRHRVDRVWRVTDRAATAHSGFWFTEPFSRFRVHI